MMGRGNRLKYTILTIIIAFSFFMFSKASVKAVEIKDEQSGEIINKIVCYELEGYVCFLTTQEVAGLNLDLYNDKYYEANHFSYSDYYFHDGWFEYSIGSLDYHNYCVYQGYIWTYDEEEYCFGRLASINDDGTFTVVEDGVEVIYIYKGKTSDIIKSN